MNRKYCQLNLAYLCSSLNIQKLNIQIDLVIRLKTAAAKQTFNRVSIKYKISVSTIKLSLCHEVYSYSSNKDTDIFFDQIGSQTAFIIDPGCVIYPCFRNFNIWAVYGLMLISKMFLCYSCKNSLSLRYTSMIMSALL